MTSIPKFVCDNLPFSSLLSDCRLQSKIESAFTVAQLKALGGQEPLLVEQFLQGEGVSRDEYPERFNQVLSLAQENHQARIIADLECEVELARITSIERNRNAVRVHIANAHAIAAQNDLDIEPYKQRFATYRADAKRPPDPEAEILGIPCPDRF